MSAVRANRRGMLWAGVSALSYATMNVFLRYVALDVDPFLAAFMRTLPVTFYCWFMVIRRFELRGRVSRTWSRRASSGWCSLVSALSTM